jgi:hypothetical protein
MRPTATWFQARHSLVGLTFSPLVSTPTGDELCKPVLKGHAMSSIHKKKSPLELADLILQHNPGASMETITNVISEWGGLFDDHRFRARDSIDMKSAGPTGQANSNRSNGAFTQSSKRLDS